MKKVDIELNPSFDYLKKFVEELPSFFDKEGEVIYEGRNVLKIYHIEGTDLVVKGFKKPMFINRIAYTFFRKSKARRSYEHAFELLKRNCLTPVPVALIEIKEGGLLKQSFYISLYETKSCHVRDYMDGTIQDDQLLKAIAEFTAGLHEKEIFHKDYSPGNILFHKDEQGSYQFSLIDINRLSFKKFYFIERCKNFDRLSNSFEVASRIGTYYATYIQADVPRTVKLINKYSDKFFLQKAYHLSRKEIRKTQNILKAYFGPIQQYRIYRNIRTLLGEKEDTKLFSKEYQIYKKHIEKYDYRTVLKRRYKYYP